MTPDLQALLALLPEIEHLEDDPFSITSKHVRIIIAGIKSIQGNVLVPREPTALMKKAGERGLKLPNRLSTERAASVYRAMLSAVAAAPSPAPQADEMVEKPVFWPKPTERMIITVAKSIHTLAHGDEPLCDDCKDYARAAISAIKER